LPSVFSTSAYHLGDLTLSGISKFQGSCLHSWEYKHPDSFVGKRVVVIGIGNSGADVANEISCVTEQVWCYILILLLGVTLIPAETVSQDFLSDFNSHRPILSVS
jgi:alkyl hydroperoxide reductase subunit AhpF